MVDDPNTAPLRITSEYEPDLELVKRFIQQKFAEGALAVLLATVLALLTRMRDLNTELRKQLELGRRKRPPSETLVRLQVELLLWGDDEAGKPKQEANKPSKKPKKRTGGRLAGAAPAWNLKPPWSHGTSLF